MLIRWSARPIGAFYGALINDAVGVILIPAVIPVREGEARLLIDI